MNKQNLSQNPTSVKSFDTPQEALEKVGIGIIDPPELDILEAAKQGDADARKLEEKTALQKEEPYFLKPDEFYKLFKHSWLVKGVLPKKGIAAVYGRSGCGKTFFVLDLSMHVHEGKPFYGRKVKQAPIVYICLEGQYGFSNRLQAWEQENKKKIAEKYFIKASDFVLTNIDENILKNFPKDCLVIIDTLKAAAPGSDENSNIDMGIIVQKAQEIQNFTNGLVLIVHHCGKDEAKGLRGHSSFHAALDAIIEIKGQSGSITVTIEKNKEGIQETLGRFTLHQVQIGIDEDGDPITSCVVEHTDAQIQETKLTKDQKLAWESLNKIAQDGQADTSTWRRTFYEAKGASEDANEKAFQRASGHFKNVGYIAENGQYTLINKQADKADK